MQDKHRDILVKVQSQTSSGKLWTEQVDEQLFQKQK